MGKQYIIYISIGKTYGKNILGTGIERQFLKNKHRKGGRRRETERREEKGVTGRGKEKRNKKSQTTYENTSIYFTTPI